MCALWFHQTVNDRLPIYGKYRNITPYPHSPESTDTRVPVERVNTEVNSALPLYNTPCHPADPESGKILGLVSVLLRRGGHLRSPNLNDGISVSVHREAQDCTRFFSGGTVRRG
jgi:hypothetical protein